MKKILVKTLQVVVICLLSASLAGAEVKRSLAPEMPLEWFTYNIKAIQFDARAETWFLIPDKPPIIDSWMWRDGEEAVKRYIEKNMQPYPIKGKHKYKLAFKKIEARKPDDIAAKIMAIGAISPRKRFVLINPESGAGISPTTPIHPHLGMLAVGTVAERQGYDVVLHDELQGQADLNKLIEPNDIVGFSVAPTGMHRAVEFARQAKRLGARCVLFGNDAAGFRPNPILSLKDKPVDVVATGNSTDAIARFFRLYDGNNLDRLAIPGIQTKPGLPERTNSSAHLQADAQDRKLLRLQGQYNETDGFINPNLRLFPMEYWEKVWNGFKRVYGHKHRYAQPVRNALGHIAQGCTQPRNLDACRYCAIKGVSDVRIPSLSFVEQVLQNYSDFGITEFFNVTDSSYGMVGLLRALETVGSPFQALTVYGRAQEIATSPQLLERWLALAQAGVFQVNIGLDAGDETMLEYGVGKAPYPSGMTRLEQNLGAVLNVVTTGAYLHFSVIFGGLGETLDSCRRTMDMVRWIKSVGKTQVNVGESDALWLNFGAPLARIFTDYKHARELAQSVGKDISLSDWQACFWNHRNELTVPMESERAWYKYFTFISFEEAEEFNNEVNRVMKHNVGSIPGRAFHPRPQEEA